MNRQTRLNIKALRKLLTMGWFRICAILFIVIVIIEWQLSLVDSDYRAKWWFLAPVIVSILYSIVAGGIFFFINDYWPSRMRTEISEKYIDRQLGRISELLRQMKEDAWPLFFEKVRRWEEEEYVAEFEKVNLYECYFFDKTQTKLNIMKSKAEQIAQICEALMASYNKYMSNEQIDFVYTVYSSQLVSDNIRPVRYDIPEDVRPTDSNQEIIGKEIYRLYKMRR